MAQILLVMYNLMYSRIIHITLLAVAFFLAFSVSPSQAQDVPSQHEQDLLQLINEARENPLAVATSLGMDADQILQDLPELEDILTNGLPPLSFNEKLYAAADAHTQDMLENNYYSHTSLDGRNYDDRIVEKGYDPLVTGESLGMLAFSNFIEPAEAVALIFESMFRDELDPARTEDRNILDPDLEEAGVAMGTGTLNLSGSLYNVYLATCDFGAGKVQESIIREMELQILQLINQARAKPFEVGAALGIDVNELSYLLPDLYNTMTEGLPPLASDQRLFRAAQAHSTAMAQGDFYCHESEDGRYYEERISDEGYNATLSGEVLSRVRASDYPDPQAAVQALFDEIFKKELDPSYQGDRVILNPDMEDAGVGVALGEISSSGTGGLYYIATCDLGSGGSGTTSLVGVVFEDKDGDGLYTPGEGLEDEPVLVYGAGLHLETDEQGGVQSEVDPGGYLVILFNQTEPLKIMEIYVGEENVWVQFNVAENVAE